MSLISVPLSISVQEKTSAAAAAAANATEGDDEGRPPPPVSASDIKVQLLNPQSSASLDSASGDAGKGKIHI